MPLFSFAKRVGVTYTTAHRWIKTGLHDGAVKLAARRVGGRVHVSWSDYEDFQRRLEAWQRPMIDMPTTKERRRHNADNERWLAEMGML